MTDDSGTRPEMGPDQASAAALVELNALLGRGTRYTGKLYFVGRIRLEGRFEGEIRCAEVPEDGVLVIGEGAELEGDIEVGVCIVTGGNVRANIRARHAIELHAPSSVFGDLHAPNVFIDRGVQFEGNCKMAPLDAPERDAGAEDVRLASEPEEPPASAAGEPQDDPEPSPDTVVSPASSDPPER